LPREGLQDHRFTNPLLSPNYKVQSKVRETPSRERRDLPTKISKKTWFLIFIIPFTLLVLYLSRSIIAPFVFAFFLAYAINPLVEFLQQKGAPRNWAILTVYLVILLAGVLVFGIVIPRLIRDLTGVMQRLPELFETLQEMEGKYSELYWRLPVQVKQLIAQITARGEIMLRNSLINLAQGIVDFFSHSLIYLLVPLLAYYISRDYPKLKQSSRWWLLSHFGPHWTNAFLKIDNLLKLYIRSQLLDTLIVGLMIGLGLSLLGLDIAFLLGLLAGALNLIPYFGPVLGAIPAVLFGLLHSPWTALYVVILFLLVNQLEVMVLTPRIIGGSLRMSPILVVYLILIGGQIFGLVGMVFAVPLGSIVLSIITSFYEICFARTRNEAGMDKIRPEP
jgi:predicted PurR-regulated permease PerM